MDNGTCRVHAQKVNDLTQLSIRLWDSYQIHLDAMEIIKLNIERAVISDKQFKNEPSRKVEIQSRLQCHEQWMKNRDDSRQIYSEYKSTQGKIEYHRMLFYLNLRQLGPVEQGVFIPEGQLMKTSVQF